VSIPRIPEDIFNTTVVVRRAVLQTSDIGKVAPASWSGVATASGVRARLDTYRYGGGLSTRAQQGYIDVPTHALFCDSDIDVQVGDKVDIDSVEYDVLEAFVPGGFEHHKEVWVKRG